MDTIAAISTLSDHLLVRILKRVPAHDLLLHIRLVCVRWNTITCTQVCETRNVLSLLECSSASAVHKVRTGVQRLYGCYGISSLDVDYLYFNRKLFENASSKLVSILFSSIQHLSIVLGSAYQKDGFNGFLLPLLDSLKQNLRSLKIHVFTNADRKQEDGFDEWRSLILHIKSFPELCSLTLYDDDDSNVTFKKRSNLNLEQVGPLKLEELNLGLKLSELGFGFLDHLRQLKRFAYLHSIQDSSGTFNVAEQLNSGQLTHLTLLDSTENVLNRLKVIFAKCSSLNYVHLSMENLDYGDLINLISSTKSRLRHLKLSHFDDDCLTCKRLKSSKAIKSLTHLTIQYPFIPKPASWDRGNCVTNMADFSLVKRTLFKNFPNLVDFTVDNLQLLDECLVEQFDLPLVEADRDFFEKCNGYGGDGFYARLESPSRFDPTWEAYDGNGQAIGDVDGEDVGEEDMDTDSLLDDEDSSSSSSRDDDSSNDEDSSMDDEDESVSSSSNERSDDFLLRRRLEIPSLDEAHKALDLIAQDQLSNLTYLHWDSSDCACALPALELLESLSALSKLSYLRMNCPVGYFEQAPYPVLFNSLATLHLDCGSNFGYNSVIPCRGLARTAPMWPALEMLKLDKLSANLDDYFTLTQADEEWFRSLVVSRDGAGFRKGFRVCLLKDCGSDPPVEIGPFQRELNDAEVRKRFRYQTKFVIDKLNDGSKRNMDCVMDISQRVYL